MTKQEAANWFRAMLIGYHEQLTITGAYTMTPEQYAAYTAAWFSLTGTPEVKLEEEK